MPVRCAGWPSATSRTWASPCAGDATSVTGTYIGLHPDGATAAGNGAEGLVVRNNAAGVTIGGTAAADGNVVANNAQGGIGLWASSNATVWGNLVGTAADGTTPAPNEHGIYVGQAVDAAIGGPNTGEGNVISGNLTEGVLLTISSQDAEVAGNLIGVGSDGSTPVGNGGHGVEFRSAATGHVIGGTSAADGNLIANNGADGVAIATTGTDPFVAHNAIHSNGGLGIDHDDDGVSANDPGDGDGLPNAPVLLAAVSDDGVTDLEFSLDVAAGTYRIDVYENPSGADPTGYGEGEVHLTTFDITHPGGDVVFTQPIAASAGTALSATASATGPERATSEFSNGLVSVDIGASLLLDDSRRRSDAVRLRGATADQPGAVGEAIDLPGAASRVVGPALDVTTTGLTLAAHVEADALGGDHAVISKLDSSGNVVYELAVDGTTGEAVATIRLTGTPITARGGSLTAGTWHALASTWDGIDLVLHVDGAEVDRVAAVGVLATDPMSRITIGNRSDRSRPLDGRVDHIVVRAASTQATEIEAVARAVADPASYVTVGAEQTSTPGAWTVSGTQTRSGGFALEAPATAGADAAAWAVATGIDEPGLVFESWWWVSTDTGIDLSAGTRAGISPTDQYEAALTSPSGWELRQRTGVTETVDAPGAGSPVTGSWVKVEIWTDQLGDTRILIDDVEVTGWTTQGGALTTGSAGLRTGLLPGVEDWFIDDARGRKLITPEPLTSLSSVDRN